MAAAPGAKMGDAYIDVRADASKVGPELEAQVSTALEEVAASAETSMTAVGASAAEAAGKVEEAFATAGRASQEAFLKAQATAETASARVVAAKDTERQAIERVKAAEAELDAARAAGAGEAAIEAAEGRLLTARGKAEVAAGKVTAATAVEQSAKATLATATEGLAATEEAAATKVEASAARIGTAAEGIKTKWMGMTALVGGVAVGAMVKGAADYQSLLTKLQTTAGESAGNIKSVGDGMLAMAGQVGIGAEELAKGMYTVDSAGIHGADSLVVLKAAAQGAKQENADLEKVTDAVTTALHDYHLPASDAAKVTSEMIDAVAHGKTTFDALTGSLHSVTPLASILHVSLADTTAVLSSMTASGESADQATQNMADTLRHLANPTNTMTQELSSLGINSTDLADKLGKKGLSGTLQDVEEAIVQHMDPATQRVLLPALNQSKSAAADMHAMIGQMPAGLQKLSEGLLSGSTNIADYTKAAKAMGGQAGPMATQFLSLYKSQDGFNAALKSGSPAAQAMTAAMAKAFGTASAMNVALQSTGENAAATAQAAKDIAAAVPQADGSIRGWDEVQGNFNQKLAETKAGIESWGIKIGQALLPAVTALLSGLKDTVDWLTRHKTVSEALIVVIGGIATAWAAIKIGQGIKSMADDFTSAGKAIGGAVAKVWAYAFATDAANESSRAAAAGQKIAAAATWLWNAAMDANPVMIVVLAVIALIAAVVLVVTHFKQVSAIATEVGHWFAWLGGVIWGALKTAFDWVKDHWLLILEIIAGPIGWAIALFTNFGPQILHALESAGKAILGWITSAGEWFASLPGKAWNALVTFGPKVASAIGNGLVTALGAITDFLVKAVMFFVTLPIKIVIVLAVLGEKLWGAFVAAFNYLVTNIPIWLGKALHFFEELPGKVWSALVSLRDKLHDAIWTAIDAVIGWVTDWVGKVVAFFEAMPGKVWNALVTLHDKLHDAFWAAINWLLQNIPIWIGMALAFFEQLPGRIWTALSSLGSTIGNAFKAAFDWARTTVSTGIDDIVRFVTGLPGRLVGLAASMLSAGKSLISSLISGLGNAIGEVGDIGKKVVNSIIGFVNSHVIDNIDSALNFSVMGVNIHAGVIPHIPMLANGGVIDRPTLAIVGEAGPEAVVPLTRPGRASQVMADAGLSGGSSGGGPVHLTVQQNLTVPKQATAAQAAALFEQNLTRSLALGARSGITAGLSGLGATA